MQTPAKRKTHRRERLCYLIALSVIEDPRIERCKKHNLLDILFLTVSAVLSGAQGREDIEEFGHSKLEWLRRFIELPTGIPRHDTIARVMTRLDPNETVAQ